MKSELKTLLAIALIAAAGAGGLGCGESCEDDPNPVAASGPAPTPTAIPTIEAAAITPFTQTFDSDTEGWGFNMPGAFEIFHETGITAGASAGSLGFASPANTASASALAFRAVDHTGADFSTMFDLNLDALCAATTGKTVFQMVWDNIVLWELYYVVATNTFYFNGDALVCPSCPTIGSAGFFNVLIDYSQDQTGGLYINDSPQTFNTLTLNTPVSYPVSRGLVVYSADAVNTSSCKFYIDNLSFSDCQCCFC